MRVKGLTLVIALMSALLVGRAPRLSASGGTLKVDNKSSSRVTVNVDGSYCCMAYSGDVCTCRVSVGSHKLRATRNDNGKPFEDTFEVGEDETYTFTLKDD